MFLIERPSWTVHSIDLRYDYILRLPIFPHF